MESELRLHCGICHFCCWRLSFAMIVGQEKQRDAELNGTNKNRSLMALMENE
jgi:hypothetical protein